MEGHDNDALKHLKYHDADCDGTLSFLEFKSEVADGDGTLSFLEPDGSLSSGKRARDTYLPLRTGRIHLHRGQ
jgi:hypothetical protein